MRIAPAITITEEQALQLQAWERGRSVEVRLAQRVQMILLAAELVSVTHHLRALQGTLASGIVLQVDQAAPAY